MSFPLLLWAHGDSDVPIDGGIVLTTEPGDGAETITTEAGDGADEIITEPE